MSTSEATYAPHLHEWLPSPPELPAPCIHIKAPGRGKRLAFTCWTACSRCIAEAG